VAGGEDDGLIWPDVFFNAPGYSTEVGLGEVNVEVVVVVGVGGGGQDEKQASGG